MKKLWRTFDGTRLRHPIKETVRSRLAKELADGHNIKVCIGADSQVKGRDTDFATVIVFLRKGKGGFMFITAESIQRSMSIKERMLREVMLSIEVAYELCDVFTAFNTDLEVHADINTNPAFKSNNALKDAVGYISGMGFAFRAKPEAFAGSNCANKIVQ